MLLTAETTIYRVAICPASSSNLSCKPRGEGGVNMLVWGGQTRQKFSEIGTSKFSSLFLLFTRWKTAAKCRATVNEGQGERWERGGDEQRMIMILLCSLFTTRGAQNLCGKRFNFSSSCSSTTSFVGFFPHLPLRIH